MKQACDWAVLHTVAALSGGTDAVIGVNTVAKTVETPNIDVDEAIDELINSGYLGRKESGVYLTNDGVDYLRERSAGVRRLFMRPEALELVGTTESGLGKGKEFVSMNGYQRQFVDKLGYEPFPGTFNVSLSEASVGKRCALQEFESIQIDGWEEGGRSFGPVWCYPAVLETVDLTERYEPLHVIVPERTEHDPSQLELLADDNLRRSLGLDDGDEVVVRIRP